MELVDQFKDFIRNDDYDQQKFIDFIKSNFDKIVNEYSLEEVMDYIINYGDRWLLGATLSLHQDIFFRLGNLAELIAISGKDELIDVLQKDFWLNNFFNVCSICSKNQNTDFLCKVLIISKIKLEEITDIEFLNINKLLFIACTRNEKNNIKTLVEFGADPSFIFDDVNGFTILKRNLFNNSLEYVRNKKSPLTIPITSICQLEQEECDEMVEDYKRSKSIELLSYLVGKFGDEILIKKSSSGETIFDFIISTGNIKFFDRMFSILKDKSDKNIRYLVDKSNKLEQYEIMNRIIEGVVK